MKKTHAFVTIATIVLLLPLGISKADVVLEVDVSNLSAVTFTATNANSENTVGPFNSNDFGITLVDFFNGNSTEINGGGLDISGQLEVLDSAGGPTRSPLVGIFVAEFAAWTFEDVNFYNANNFFDVYFDQSQQAMTGQITVNFSNIGFTGIPSVGTTGNLITNSPDTPAVIGQWQIVAPQAIPEPGTGLVACLFSVIGLAVYRRR